MDLKIDLNRFPKLFEVPTVSYPGIVHSKDIFRPRFMADGTQSWPLPPPEQPAHIQALLAEYAGRSVQINEESLRTRGRPNSDHRKVTDDLRLRYARSEPVRSAYFADRILQEHVLDDEVLNDLSGWQLGTDDSLAVENLLRQAEEHASLFCLRAACLLKASDICLENELVEEAKSLLLALCASSRIGLAGMEWGFGNSRFTYIRDALGRPETLDDQLPASGPVHPFNPITLDQQQFLTQLITKNFLTDHHQPIFESVQPCIRFSPADREITRGCTKLGGLPDVPQGWKWPGRLEFLAQFNLADAVNKDPNGLLPAFGLLSVFLESIEEWDREPKYRVYHFLDDPDSLQPAVDSRQDGSWGRDHHPPFVYKEVPMRPYLAIDFNISALETGDESNPENAWYNQEKEVLYSIWEESRLFIGTGWDHQLLGSSMLDYVYSKLDFNPRDWTLLCQLDSSHEAGMMFNDAGTVFILIGNEDLLVRRFDRLRIDLRNG